MGQVAAALPGGPEHLGRVVLGVQGRNWHFWGWQGFGKGMLGEKHLAHPGDCPVTLPLGVSVPHNWEN